MNTNKTINNEFINCIYDKIPTDINIVKVIMDVLNISKEAAYRRLRGDVPFSFIEVATLARKLSISIDNFTGTHAHDKILFQLINVAYKDTTEYDYMMVKQFIEAVKFINNDEKSEFMYASNMFPQFIFAKYYHLAKFHSFKWGYQNLPNITKPYFEMDYPTEFFEMSVKTVEELTYLNNTCYVLDKRVFEAMVNDIKYFHSINYLNDENVKDIKAELLNMLDDFEILLTKGTFNTNNKIQVYLSDINFETTHCYLMGNSFNLSMISIFGLHYVTSLDERALVTIKKWIQSLKKSSILISEGGQIERTQFLNKQRNFFNSL